MNMINMFPVGFLYAFSDFLKYFPSSLAQFFLEFTCLRPPKQ